MADESAKSNSATLLRQEYPLLLSVLSMALFMAFGKGWLADLGSPAWYAVMLAWLLVVMSTPSHEYFTILASTERRSLSPAVYAPSEAR